RRSGVPGAAASRRPVLDAARGGETRRPRRDLARALLPGPRSTLQDRRPRRPCGDGGMTMTSLAGKHALVTGGGSGIGAAIAFAMAQAGANVTICGRRMPDLEFTAERHANIHPH